MRSEPVNDGPWTYERVGGGYLRIQAARVEGLHAGWPLCSHCPHSKESAVIVLCGFRLFHIALLCLYS